MVTKKIIFLKSIIFSYGTKVSMLAIGLAYTYLIANYLGPTNYGIVSYYIALIISIISMGGICFLQGLYNLFIPRSKSKSFFMNILKWQYCLAILLFTIVFIFSESIAHLLHKEEFLFLRYAAFLLLILPLHDSFVFLFRGFKLFGKILKVEVAISIMNLCFAFLFVVSLSYGIYGVIYAQIISFAIGILMFAWFFKRLHFRNHIVNMIDVKKYSRGAFMLNLFRSSSIFSFTVFIGMFISPVMLGMYFIAQKIAGSVIGSVQSSIVDVITPFAVEDYKDKSFLNRYLSYSIKITIIISVIMVVLLIIVCKPLLTLLFPSYASAYSIIILYSIVISLRSFNVLNSAFLSQNRMDILARVYFYDFIVVIVFSLLLMPAYGIYGALFVLMISGLIKILLLLYYLKDLGLRVDFIIRKDDVRYFIRMLKSFCGR